MIPDMKYDGPAVEKKWQAKWEQTKLYCTDLKKTEKKYYNLAMFPYPSGDKLHVGHWYNYAPADSFGRYMRLRGYNVFEPMGYDSFGLPAENYAIKTGIHPTKSIASNVATMTRQLKEIGAMYDWEKAVVTSNPDYYKWTQWIFLLLYKRGLAYRKNAPVNWCPSCQTVLANEQVQDGTCDRCHTQVTKKDLTQWFFRIKDYAQRLLDFGSMDWPEKTKLMQEYWIGRSEGAEIDFELVPDGESENRETGEKITVFTTRADTLFGCTYLVLAPEHPLISRVVIKKKRKAVSEYQEATRRTNDIERAAEGREKTGVATGAYCLNPANGERIPIWIADYVLAQYGTGAVMAVPAHDQRDYEFAKKFKLTDKTVIIPRHGAAQGGMAFTDYGVLSDSGEFDGLTSEEARVAIVKKLCGSARQKISFKLRDWLISRQRYWGAPIPIVYCEKCREVPVPEKDLPVLLPKEVDFEPKGDGKSPLASSPDFVNTQCPKCKGAAAREVDTMDTFMCSSWYFLRFVDAHNDKEPFGKAVVKKWLPVDMYIGGPEHACMHLLYARFFTKVLYDAKLISFDEPFSRLVHQGIITKNGAKMSKSKGNVVSPDEFVERYGSDVFRMYLMFMGPFTAGGDWSDRGITGIARFAQRVWDLVVSPDTTQEPDEVTRAVNHAVKKVGDDIEVFHFNTAVSTLMELINLAVKSGMSKKSKQRLVQILAPLAPHLAEECWEALGEAYSVFNSTWPKFDEALATATTFELVIQVNGKLRGRVAAPMGISKEEAIELALREASVAPHVAGRKRVKDIFVPNRLLNLVVGLS